MDGCSRQNPAYRPATERAPEGALSICSPAPLPNGTWRVRTHHRQYANHFLDVCASARRQGARARCLPRGRRGLVEGAAAGHYHVEAVADGLPRRRSVARRVSPAPPRSAAGRRDGATSTRPSGAPCSAAWCALGDLIEREGRCAADVQRAAASIPRHGAFLTIPVAPGVAGWVGGVASPCAVDRAWRARACASGSDRLRLGDLPQAAHAAEWT